MAFSGSVSCMGLADVVQFLAQNGVEGALTVVGAAASVRLYLAGGRVLCPLRGGSQGRQGRLPASELDALVQRGEAVREERKKTGRPGRTGKFDRSALDEVMARAREVAQERERLEAVTGKLDQDTLQELLQRAERLGQDERHQHATEAVHQVFTWDQARFEFQPGPVPPLLLDALREGEGLVLDARALLMEVARRDDERQRSPVIGPHGTRVAERPRRSASGKHTRPSERALEGDLRGVGLAAVLQALRARRRTGTLSVTAAGREEQLCFHEGEVFVLRRESLDADDFAKSFLGDDAGERMRELTSSAMLRRRIDESQLTGDQIKALKEQFFELLFHDGAEFAFFQDVLPPEFETLSPEVTKIALETDRFLMEAIQRLGEWDGIRRTLGSGDPVLRFTDYEWKLSAVRGHERSELLLLIDGRRSLEELVRQSGLTHLEVGRVVAPLVAAGSLEVIPRPAA